MAQLLAVLKKTIWHLGTRCCYWEVRTQAQRSGRQEQDGFPGRSCLRYFALLLLLPEEQFQAIIMHLCLYLPLPTSSFFSSWRMLIRILTINLHLPLYLQAASIDGCAARLSASEVSFFTFLSIFTRCSPFVLQILLTGGHLCPTCSFILNQEKGEWKRVGKHFYILSFSFQSLSLSDQVGDLREARSSHGCAPYISPEVFHFS